MRAFLKLSIVALSGTSALFTQQSQPLLGETTTKISEHVYAIMGFPNIGIVVGTRATLIVDTGMGPKNGATIARVAARLAPDNHKIYLTTTHFHPEHAAGEPGIPGAVLIRNTVQQQEMEKHGQEMIDMFSGRSPQNKDLLAGVKLRAPDVTFSDEAAIDLGGGVTARLLWFGGAHTKGDELTFVEPDRTLISGDVVQNKVIPNIYGDGGTPSSWLAVLDRIAALDAVHVLPDHSAPGDGSMVTDEKTLITTLRTRARACRRFAMSEEAAAKEISDELKRMHPELPNTNVLGFVKSVYAEP